VGCATKSLGDSCQTFQNNTKFSFSRVKMSIKNEYGHGLEISPLEYNTNMMPQSVSANQVVIKWHILEEQRPHVLCEFASFSGYGIHFLWMTIFVTKLTMFCLYGM
jgi:hypothetical protein